jgi:hypothetical protein
VTQDTAWTARQIVAEVRREIGQFSPLIIAQRPEPLFGSVDELALELDEHDRNPPKSQRKDTPILLAGVVSASWAPEDSRSVEWRMDALVHLKATFGHRLRAVVAHNDERHDHMHFYVVMPDLKPVKGLHPGHVARQAVTDAGESASVQTAAYNTAMKKLQNDYYNQVSRKHGQARTGPRRERLGRMEWAQRQVQAELIAEVERTTERNRAESVALVESARQDAQTVIQAARASVVATKAQSTAEREDVKGLKEALRAEREKLDGERQAFRDEVGTFRQAVENIHGRLSRFERMEIAPSLGCLSWAVRLRH